MSKRAALIEQQARREQQALAAASQGQGQVEPKEPNEPSAKRLKQGPAGYQNCTTGHRLGNRLFRRVTSGKLPAHVIHICEHNKSVCAAPPLV